MGYFIINNRGKLIFVLEKFTYKDTDNNYITKSIDHYISIGKPTYNNINKFIKLYESKRSVEVTVRDLLNIQEDT